MALTLWPGRPFPLGVSCDEGGINFAVFSEGATGVDLALFAPDEPSRCIARVALPSVTAHVWHGYAPDLRPGALYGLYAHGPYAPERGLRFNPKKLLVDPYARALWGKVDWKAPVFAHAREPQTDERVLDEREDAFGVPKSVAVSDAFDWGDDRPLRTPWSRTVLYEVHVKGFTARHPGVPPELRGKFGGLAAPAAIEHLRRLGVTAVELLPVHESVDEEVLVERGLSNYWGYNTLGYFAPDQRLSTRAAPEAPVREFKQMVKALHQSGIEVILDAVYNHTCEGNHLGPTLSFKGLDNRAYYHLAPEEPRRYLDFTGCGNSLNLDHAQTLKLVLDSLRYWAEEMRVDGFRFDLATTLARGSSGDFDRGAAFFKAVHQDPVLSRLKLIAEPWDLGEDGYRLGQFPVLWSEWNGRYRDTIRRFWRGDERATAELGYRASGSSDLFALSGRKVWASINFIVSHDGFTLHDLVGYEHKHNEANREEGRDGTNENLSWNCGVEGETQDPAVIALREQQKRNLLATLLLSEGVPMICAGDELGRTQRGNNNAYCQDNELSWVDWQLGEREVALLGFAAKLVRLRQEQPVLQRTQFFQGAHIWDSTFKDLAWFRPDGREMTPEDWRKPDVRCLGYLLGGDAIPSVDEQGRRIVGDTLLVLMNSGPEASDFTLPAIEWGVEWEVVIDTAHAHPLPGQTPAGGSLSLAGRSLILLRHPVAGGPRRDRRVDAR